VPPAKLSISEVVNRVGAIYRDQARVLLPTALVIFLVAGAAGALLASASTALLFVAFAVQLIAGTIYSGMVVALVADLREGRSDRRGAELLSAVGPVMGPLLAVAIITGVGVVVGTGLFVVPGLFLLTIWAVAAAVVMVERVGPFAALGRSQQLVRGNGWPVFGVILSGDAHRARGRLRAPGLRLGRWSDRGDHRCRDRQHAHRSARRPCRCSRVLRAARPARPRLRAGPGAERLTRSARTSAPPRVPFAAVGDIPSPDPLLCGRTA